MSAMGRKQTFGRTRTRVRCALADVQNGKNDAGGCTEAYDRQPDAPRSTIGSANGGEILKDRFDQRRTPKVSS